MDTRVALKENTILKSETNGYTIRKETARGGSCIVYDAVYTAENGDKKPVRLKECYPFHLNICRKETGELIASEDEAVSFAWANAAFGRHFTTEMNFFSQAGLRMSPQICCSALTQTIQYIFHLPIWRAKPCQRTRFPT